MRLNTLTIDNFLSFGSDVSLKLRKRGLVLIEGENRDDASSASNGAGKTSVVDALVWCLFGITTRGYDGDDVINNKTKRDCAVTVSLTESKRAVVIGRYRKHAVHKNGLTVHVDDVDVTKSSTKETQEYIDRLLGLNAQTFLNSVVFGQTAGYRFSRLTDAHQKAVLDDALGITQYSAACDLARAAAREQRTLKESAEVSYEDSTRTLADLDAQLEDLQRKHKGFKTECASASARHATRLVEIKSRRAELRAQLALGDAAEAERASILAERKAKSAEHTDMIAIAGAAKAKHEMCLTRRTELAKSATTTDVPTECDECGQTITPATYEAHQRKRKNALIKATAAVVAAAAEETRVRQATKVTGAALDEIDQQLDAVNRTIAKHARLTAEDTALEQESVRLKAEKAALAEKVSPYDTLITKAQAKRESVARMRTQRRAEADAYASAEAQYTFWVEAFGTKGLRSYLIDTALPFLNTKATEFAQTLTDGNIGVTFKTQSALKSGGTAEKFGVEVTNTHGAHSYKGNSAGESGKIDLIVGLALQALVMSRARTSTNVAFFDEPFEHIDSEGAERVIELLNDMRRANDSIFVITHNTTLAELFPNTLHVIKHRGISRLED